MKSFKQLREKTLTPAEKKKREEIAKAIEKDEPDMPMDKKMAIATAQAKKVAEGKKPVSQMTPAEKKADAERRKEYNAYQKSKRNEGAEKYTVKKGNMTRKVDGKTADEMKRQGWKLIATEEVDEAYKDDDVDYKKITKTIGVTPKYKRDKRADAAQPAAPDKSAAARRKAIERHQELMRNKKKDPYQYESVDLDEGKMKEFHAMVKKGMTAAQIAKKIGMKEKDVAEFMKGMDESVEEAKEPSLKSTDYPKGTSQSAQAFKDKFAKKKKVPALKSTDYPKGTSMSATAWKKKNESVEESKDFFAFRESLTEKKDSSADLYFDTYSAAVQHAAAQAKKKGFEVVEDDWFQQVTVGKGRPKDGDTTRHTLKLTKDGKPVRKGLSIQVYNRGGSSKKPYELNYYVS